MRAVPLGEPRGSFLRLDARRKQFAPLLLGASLLRQVRSSRDWFGRNRRTLLDDNLVLGGTTPQGLITDLICRDPRFSSKVNTNQTWHSSKERLPKCPFWFDGRLPQRVTRCGPVRSSSCPKKWHPPTTELHPLPKGDTLASSLPNPRIARAPWWLQRSRTDGKESGPLRV